MKVTWIVLLLVAIIVYMYISYYIKVIPDISFKQMNLSSVNFEVLQSKTPFVINESITDVSDLLSSIFLYQYSFVKTVNTTQSWVKNNSKYLVIQVDSASTIKIAHPASQIRTSNDYHYIDLNLKPNQVIVLPFGWWVVPTQSCIVLKLDDLISKAISFII